MHLNSLPNEAGRPAGLKISNLVLNTPSENNNTNPNNNNYGGSEMPNNKKSNGGQHSGSGAAAVVGKSTFYQNQPASAQDNYVSSYLDESQAPLDQFGMDYMDDQLLSQ